MLAILLALMISEPSHAGKIKIGPHKASGTGCKTNESVHFVVSPDELSLSVLFDEMVVTAGSSTGRREESKTCSFTIPIKTPAGTSLSVTQVDYRGFVYSTKPNIFNHMSTDYNIESKPMRHFEHRFSSPSNTGFTLTESIPLHQRHKSNCSGNTSLNVATRITTKTNPQGDESMLAIDSLDATHNGRLVYRLEYSPCR